MKLQILVPQYKETEEVIKPLLDSIAIQRNVDFNDIGVIITNDGTDVKLSKYFLKQYPFEIKYIYAEHGGVSHTRNVCLDNATADYIMFCDADDCFINSLALSIIFNTINATGFYAFQSAFLEELPLPQGGILYNKRENAHVFVHGKIYKLSYIRDINLRWCNELQYHEDGYFNAIAILSCPEGKFFNSLEPFYLWCYNPVSVCRSDPYFLIKTYDQDVLAQDLIISRTISVNREGSKDLFLTQIYQTYFVCTGKLPEIEELKPYFPTIIKMTRDFFLKFKDLWDEATIQQKETKNVIVKDVSNKMGYLIEKPDYPIEKWIEDICKE